MADAGRGTGGDDVAGAELPSSPATTGLNRWPIELAKETWMRKAILQLLEAGFDALPDLPARLRMFLDVHGLPDRKRPAAMQRCKLELAQALRWLQEIAADLARAP